MAKYPPGKKVKTRWLGPVKIDVYKAKEVIDSDGSRCWGLFIPTGQLSGRIYLDQKAKDSVEDHEVLHAIEAFYRVFGDEEELRVRVIEMMREQWNQRR